MKLHVNGFSAQVYNEGYWPLILELRMSGLLTYTIILEAMEEGGFLVHVPALPEVVTGGDTEDEALGMAREAIELVLASRRGRGEKIPIDVAKPQLREVTVSVAA